MKFKILIPVYNDWQSVLRLLDNINSNLEKLNHEISIVIVNDASNHDYSIEERGFENIDSVKILNMKINQGHARCIATGLKYIYEKEDFDYIIPMDGDGEDRPEEISEFITQVKNSNDKIVVGVDNQNQLEHLVASFAKDVQIESLPNLSNNDMKLINPSNWGKL